MFHICLVTYSSLPSSGVTDDVRKSLGIGLCGYWSVWVLVCVGIGLYGYWSVWVLVCVGIFPEDSWFHLPDSFLISKVYINGIVPSTSSSSCVNFMLFVSSTLFRWSVSCCVIPVFITSKVSPK